MPILAWLKSFFAPRWNFGDQDPRAMVPLANEPQLKNLLAKVSDCRRDGRDAEALDACRDLTALLAKRAATVPDFESRITLAGCFFDAGIFFDELQQFADGAHAFQQAIVIAESLAATPAQDSRAALLAASCKNRLGLVHWNAGELDRAEHCFREAIADREALQTSQPNNEENTVYLGGACCNLGNLTVLRGDASAALPWFRRSIDLLDRSVPGCTCGCRDMHEQMFAHLLGRPSPLYLAQQFLRNALDGRASALAGADPGLRFQQVRAETNGDYLVVTILGEQLRAADAVEFRELKTELLDAVTLAEQPVMFDVSRVQRLDAEGAALLLHLSGRLTGAGDQPRLCGLSPALRAATPAVAWEENFQCFATVKEAVEDGQAG